MLSFGRFWPAEPFRGRGRQRTTGKRIGEPLVSFSSVMDMLVFAEAADNQGQGPGTWFLFTPIALIFVFYIFLIQRPQRREQQVRD